MPALSQPVQPAEEGQLVVVHVFAKRSALETKSFEQLLATSGIQVVADESKDANDPADSRSLGRLRAEQHAVRRTREPVAKQAQTDNTEEEIVLVEASPAAIELCLDSLNRDEENYMAIAVEEAAVQEAGRETVATAPTAAFSDVAPPVRARKLAEELGLAKYNRGLMPRQQELAARDKTFLYRFYSTDAQDDRYAGGRYRGGYGGYGGGLGQAKQEAEEVLADRSDESAAHQGRAIRLKSWGIVGQQADAYGVDEELRRGAAAPVDRQTRTTGESLGELQQSTLKSAADSGSDTLQVLEIRHNERQLLGLSPKTLTRRLRVWERDRLRVFASERNPNARRDHPDAPQRAAGD
jgi:hypothetical protein